MKKIPWAAALALAVCWLSAEEPAARPPFVRELKATEAVILLRADKVATQRRATYQPIKVLDVRTPEEFAAGHIEGAVNLDFNHPDFEKQLSKLDKNRPVLVHCQRGGRSSKGRDKMKQLGFARIYHLEGGFAAWKEAGGAVIKAQ